MKTNLLATLLATLAFATGAETLKAPNGGRLIHSVEPHAEFLINADKKIEIRFLSDEGKILSPATQTVTVTMGDRAAPTKLTFTQDGDKLISNTTIPTGNKLPLVLQIKTTPDAKPVTEKFNLDLVKCPTCPNLEYACICGHGGDEKGHEGHKH